MGCWLLENENPEDLLQSALRFFKFLPGCRIDRHMPKQKRRAINALRGSCCVLQACASAVIR